MKPTTSRACAPACLFLAALAVAPAHAQDLRAGAAAPVLAPLKMVRGAAVEKLDAGTVHVIEFWGEEAAAGFERDAEFARLAKAHEGLRVLGIVGPSENYDFETVKDYYDEHGKELGATVAYDEGGKLHEAWVAASGNEAPAVFVVDGNGKIAWIGGLGILPVVLPKVMSGEYDAEALTAESDAAEKLLTKLALTAAIKPSGAIAVLDELVEKWPMLESVAVIMAWDSIVTGDEPQHAVPLQKRVFDVLVKSQDAWTMNGLAWSIVDPGVELESRDLDLAMKAAQLAVEWTESQDASILDTLARVWFWKKDYKKAVEIQKQAIALIEDPDERVGLEETLQEYERLRDGG